MPIQYKIRRGTTFEANSLTLSEGEIYMDLSDKTLRVHDGIQQGGYSLAKKSELTTKVDKINITAGSVGSGSAIPIIAYNAQGQITSVSTAALNIPSNIATETYVNTQIANLVDSSPTTLNTLNELAAALGDDPNFATTISTQLGSKANISSLATVATSGSYNDLTNKPTIPSFNQLLNTTSNVEFVDLNVVGLLTTTRSTEKISTKTGSTGTVTHDFTTGSIFYHSGILADFVANFTNIPTSNDRTISVVLLLNQGPTAYMPLEIRINNISTSIKWQNGSIPLGTANGIDAVSFTFIRTDSVWTVLGSSTSYSNA